MSPLFRLSFAFAFSHKMAHSASEKKGFAEFLNQKRWHPSVILRAETGEWGKAPSVARGVEGAESRLRTQRATGFSCSITIRPKEGGGVPLNLTKRGRSKLGTCARERVALNPTHCKSPLASVN